MWGEGEGDVSSSSRHLGPRLLFPSSNGLILGQREKERDYKERYTKREIQRDKRETRGAVSSFLASGGGGLVLSETWRGHEFDNHSVCVR